MGQIAVLEAFSAMFGDFRDVAFGPASRLWPLYIVVTILIAFALFRIRRIDGPFLSWLAPRAIWAHASHIVDMKLFVFSKILSVLGIFKTVAVSAVFAAAVQSVFPEGGVGLGPLNPFLAAALALIVGDFATYWVHRIHHENRILWPFHSVHHSAEVMTPITVYRKHPLYDLSKVAVHGSLLGIAQGILLGLFPGGISIALLMGINAGYFLFNILGSNFRHSHIWLSFGPVVEHIVISPAQHQIHHSLAPEHHNKNYGEVLAVWDWMFGSLYVPKQAEILEFGLGDADGNRLVQPHDSLANALLVPLRDSGRQIRKAYRRRGARDNPVTPAE